MHFDHYLDDILPEIIKSTQQLVQIPSVKSDPLPNKPFGEGVNNALTYMLGLGQKMGFKTKNVDGYIGYIEFGTGKELVGILAHLDVVPPGTGWTRLPFGGEIVDGKIYGRGSIDDKGPAVAALYAMKAVKDSGIKFDKRIRLILGLDEESNWQCIKHYKKVEEIPTVAFVPDARYPVIHAEKGILDYKFYQTVDNEQTPVKIICIQGGTRPNVVPDFCEAVIEINLQLMNSIYETLQHYIKNSKFNIELEQAENKIILKAYGKSSHASTPEKGVNAVSLLMTTLYNSLQSININHAFITFYRHCIALENNGKSLGIAFSDHVSGELTFNVGLINVTPNQGEIIANIRYPVTFSAKEIYINVYDTVKKYDINVEELDHIPSKFLPKNHPLVQKLMAVYKEYTGDPIEPFAIGGGTYARAIENAVAFGAVFPGQIKLAHEKDEYIEIDALIKNSKIFARAIYELTK
ncbi:MAG: succinyl-diaminopimelate desuccinylase [Clostridiales bacterium]|jgi:succinyl-diaminopimelate desuccinylase|nr:succinyl-diaminopimelate desuccinylase [Clostridiales bacterium]MDK2933156.1 succinyl-diaminopimelate desuccinylase [Clostridiales bacterium]